MKKPIRRLASPIPETKDRQKAKRRQAPGRTIAARENQLISMTIDLAAKQLKEGTASSQVMTHFLKLGSTVQELEKKKLENENLLLTTKVEALKSAKKIEELYQEAITAMQIYTGNGSGKRDD